MSKEKLQKYINDYINVDYKKITNCKLEFKLLMMAYIGENHSLYFERASNIITRLQINIPVELFEFEDDIADLSVCHAENLVDILKCYEDNIGEINSFVEECIVHDFVIDMP